MAGGVSFGNATVTLGAAGTVYDVFRWASRLAARVLKAYADNRLYGQQAAAVEHEAKISFETYDISAASQSSSATPLVGTSPGQGKLQINRYPSGTDVAIILNPAVVEEVGAGGGYGDLATMNYSMDAQGTGGTEPTVTWGAAA